MDIHYIQNIENLIVKSLMIYRQLLIPDVCIIAINRIPASLTSNPDSITPPYHAIKVYTPNDNDVPNLIDLINNEITNDVLLSQQIYEDFINYAMPDGYTLTVNGLAVINVSTGEVIAVAPELQVYITPPTPIYLTNNLHQQEYTKNEPEEQIIQIPPVIQNYNTSQKPSPITTWLSTALLVAAVLYMSYYLFAR